MFGKEGNNCTLGVSTFLTPSGCRAALFLHQPDLFLRWPAGGRAHHTQQVSWPSLRSHILFLLPCLLPPSSSHSLCLRQQEQQILRVGTVGQDLSKDLCLVTWSESFSQYQICLCLPLLHTLSLPHHLSMKPEPWTRWDGREGSQPASLYLRPSLGFPSK